KLGPEAEVRLTIRPADGSTSGRNASHTRRTPRVFTSRMARKSPTWLPSPALLTTAWSGGGAAPWTAATCWAARATDSSLATSSSRSETRSRQPARSATRRSTAACPRPRSRDPSSTAVSSWSRRMAPAMASPIPLLPPVTRIRLISSSADRVRSRVAHEGAQGCLDLGVVEGHRRLADVELEPAVPRHRGGAGGAKQPDAAFLGHPVARLHGRLRIERQEHVHHVDLRRGRQDRDAADGAEDLGDAPGALVVGLHPRQAPVQEHGGGGDAGRQRVQVAARAALPDDRLVDEVPLAQQHGAGQGADPLVEGHVAGVEAGADLRVAAAVAGGALP